MREDAVVGGLVMDGEERDEPSFRDAMAGRRLTWWEGREGGREGGKEVGREERGGGGEGGRDEGRGREGGRERWREREGGRERWRLAPICL